MKEFSCNDSTGKVPCLTKASFPYFFLSFRLIHSFFRRLFLSSLRPCWLRSWRNPISGNQKCFSSVLMYCEIPICTTVRAWGLLAGDIYVLSCHHRSRVTQSAVYATLHESISHAMRIQFFRQKSTLSFRRQKSFFLFFYRLLCLMDGQKCLKFSDPYVHYF